MSFTSSKVKIVDSNLVEKILEQGQKLRNSIVESILKNDPFSTEIIYNNHYNTPRSSKTELEETSREKNSIPLDDQRLDAFIKGDCMTKEEQKLALETLQSLSAPDLCETTERSLKSSNVSGCKCYICEVYNANYLSSKSNLRNQNTEEYEIHKNKITKNIQDKYKADSVQSLKFVDSFKVAVNTLVLNDTGNQKVLSTISDKKVPCNITPNFFLEYKLPDCLVNVVKHKSKVDSGLDPSQVRLSSRKTSNTINFKQVTIHDIKSLDKINLKNCDIRFKVSFRNCKQKNAVVLGYAKFSFEEFLLTKNLSCPRGLVVFLNENSPISVGVLKLSLQLGCGRLYFGQEFIDAITLSNKDTVLLDSDDSTNQLLSESAHHTQQENVKEQSLEQQSNQISPKPSLKSAVDDARRVDHSAVEKKSPKPPPAQKSKQNSARKESQDLAQSIEKQRIQETEPFSQSETSVSQVVGNTSNPTFNFHQIIPLVFEDDFLLRLRENYMVIEFWQKNDTTSTVFGVTKISLHQFYLAYRNSVILKYLIKNRLPVVGTDWWEPIYSPGKEDLRGQVQILTALGTEEQINNLKSDRGFPNSFVKANFSDPKITKSKPKSDSGKPPARPFITFKLPQKIAPKYCEKSTNTSIRVLEKSDAVTQSNEAMDENNGNDGENNPTQDVLGSFIGQLRMGMMQRNVRLENGTDTDAVRDRSCGESRLEQAQSKTNLELKRTTDLLDSLQKALSFGSVAKSPSSTPDIESFRATIVINSANNLPSRKKCKSRKSRSRSAKNEDSILPSCYVSFETLSENDVKITPVVSESTSPVWNYKCDVRLPVDLLRNSRKRLIFKVWKQIYNASSAPNMQVDTVLGFAAVDLTVLVTGFPNVQGWFNIIDFSGKCHGQINIHVTPLEDLTKYKTNQKNHWSDPRSLIDPPALQIQPLVSQIQPPAPQIPEDLLYAPTETLSRVLKRKFTELDEITQRLRLRLSDVTTDNDGDSDDATGNCFADEFERDINSLCVEEDFDLVDFDEEARRMDSERGGGEGSNSGSLLRKTSDDGGSGDEMAVDEKKGGATSSCGLEGGSERSERECTSDENKGEVEGKRYIIINLNLFEFM